MNPMIGLLEEIRTTIKQQHGNSLITEASELPTRTNNHLWCCVVFKEIGAGKLLKFQSKKSVNVLQSEFEVSLFKPH